MEKKEIVIKEREIIMTKKEFIIAVIASIIFWPSFYYFMKLVAWLLLKSEGMI